MNSNGYRNLARAVSIAGMLCGAGMIAAGFYKGNRELYISPSMKRYEQLSSDLYELRTFLDKGSTLDELIENAPFTDFKPEIKRKVEEYMALRDDPGLIIEQELYTKRNSAVLCCVIPKSLRYQT